LFLSQRTVSNEANTAENMDKDLYEQSINGEDIDFAELAEGNGNINDDDNGIS
jgi:MraZ protein